MPKKRKMEPQLISAEEARKLVVKKPIPEKKPLSDKDREEIITYLDEKIREQCVSANIPGILYHLKGEESPWDYRHVQDIANRYGYETFVCADHLGIDWIRCHTVPELSSEDLSKMINGKEARDISIATLERKQQAARAQFEIDRAKVIEILNENIPRLAAEGKEKLVIHEIFGVEPELELYGLAQLLRQHGYKVDDMDFSGIWDFSWKKTK